jgi:transcriptional regulator with XRE-family HTH domain
MKDRITEFLVKENISPAEFADKIGVQRSSVSHVLSGRNYPGASFLQKMLTSYKNLNPRWLLLGEGFMIEAKNSVKEPTLFSVPQSGDKYLNNSLEKSGEVTPVNNALKNEEKKVFETKFLKTTVTESKPELSELINNASENKEIEKIVLFFKDKTFSIYSPSK